MLSGIKLLDFSGADWVIAGGAIAAAYRLRGVDLVARLGRRPRPEAAS